VSRNHLNDDQLQDYLDGNFHPDDPVVVHLEQCPRCREALDVYRNLYEALEKDPVGELSPGFADVVMERLPEIRPVAEPVSPGRFQIRDSLAFLIAMAAVLAASIYFIDPGSLLDSFSGWFKTPAADYKLVDEIGTVFSGIDLKPMIIIFVIVTLGGIAMVDRTVSRRRHDRKPVNFLV